MRTSSCWRASSFSRAVMSASICACSRLALAPIARWPARPAPRRRRSRPARCRAPRFADRVEREQRVALVHLRARAPRSSDVIQPGLRRRDQRRFAFDIAEPVRVLFGRTQAASTSASSKSSHLRLMPRAPRAASRARALRRAPRSAPHNRTACGSSGAKVVRQIAASSSGAMQSRTACCIGNLAEFAALHSGLQQTAEQRQSALDDFLAIDAREVGEIARFRDHHLGQHHEIARRDEMAKPEQQLARAAARPARDDRARCRQSPTRAWPAFPGSARETPPPCSRSRDRSCLWRRAPAPRCRPYVPRRIPFRRIPTKRRFEDLLRPRILPPAPARVVLAECERFAPIRH